MVQQRKGGCLMIFTHRKTGDKHICRTQPSEDALEVFRLKNYSVIILSDGCSSSKYGFEASNRIAKRLSSSLRYPSAYKLGFENPLSFLDEYMPDGKEKEFSDIILKEIRQETDYMLKLYNCERKDLCCTLILSIIKYDPKTKKNSALILCIGDGIVASYNAKCRCASLITDGDNIDDDSRRTYFCTSANAHEHVRVYRANPFDSILISSDGLTHIVNTVTEIDEFMENTASLLAPSDAQFSKSMNLLLASYLYRDTHRDLNDDCTFAYYTTDKRAVHRLVKNNKFHT